MKELIALVDEDTAAFNRIMTVFSMPKTTDEEKAARAACLESATIYATEVPLRTMKAASKALPILYAMAETGNPASASDAGVGVLAAVAAIRGADMNVRINAAGLKDQKIAERLTSEAKALVREALEKEKEILALVNKHIDKE